jgi:signal peptidase I
MKLTRLTIREYAESLAVAFILAMIIRHYVAEAFRIPTSSMEPTLIGSETHGDRILVNKFEFDLHGPERWDIVVFKIDDHRIRAFRRYYQGKSLPEGTRIAQNGEIDHPGSAEYVNYVKRLVGLPGEWIQVKNGDLFVRPADAGPDAPLTICRKPPDIEERLLVPVTADELLAEHEGFLDRWARTAGVTETDGVVHFRGTLHGPCEVRYRYDIEDRIDTDEETTTTREANRAFNIVGDLKLAFRFRHVGGSGRLVARLMENDITYEFILPLGSESPEPPLIAWDGEEVARAARPFVPTGEHRVEVSNIDARAVLRVDGVALVTFVNNTPSEAEARHVRLRDGRGQTSRAGFGVEECDIDTRDVSLWRDIYYTTGSTPVDARYAVSAPRRLGPDEYFMMGDNSPNSFDSRNWGVVKRPRLLGEAFFVFWPIPRWQFVK